MQPEQKYFSLDLETKGLITKGKVPEIISFSYAFLDGYSTSEAFTSATVNRLNDLISAGHIPVFHNSSFDVPILKANGVAIQEYEDTMLMLYCVQPGSQVSLETLGGMIGAPKLPKSWDGQYPEEVTPELLEYGLQDAVTTIKGFFYLRDRLSEDRHTAGLYKYLELPYSLIIQEMESVGLCFDLDKANTFCATLNQERAQILEECLIMFPTAPGKVEYYANKETGDKKDNHTYEGLVEHPKTGKPVHSFTTTKEFNPASTDHKAWALQQQGWEPVELTPKGKPKVDEDVISGLTHLPIAALFNRYAKISKLISTFLEPLSQHADENNMVHGSYHQCRTVTGRLSCSNPNMQQIPKHGEHGETMRSLIVCPNEDVALFNGDLSNIECRMVAYYMLTVCDDPVLAKIFIEGQDFHTANSESWGVERSIAKKYFFSKIYGAGNFNLATNCGISVQEVEAIAHKVDLACPSLNVLIETVIDAAIASGGVIHTLFGRRLSYPNLLNKSGQDYARARRQVFNALIQGSSADVLKYLTLKSLPIIRKYQAVVAGAVHDELLGYVSRTRASELCAALTSLWGADRVLDPVPVAAEFKFGNNWSETH